MQGLKGGRVQCRSTLVEWTGMLSFSLSLVLFFFTYTNVRSEKEDPHIPDSHRYLSRDFYSPCFVEDGTDFIVLSVRRKKNKEKIYMIMGLGELKDR